MEEREIIPLKQSLSLSMSLPGSKSITQRAFLCAALAKGTSKIYNSLVSDDTRAMLLALKKLGIRIIQKKEYTEVFGTGGQFKKGVITLNAGASGVAARFLTALMTLREGETIIAGDSTLMKRPMEDLAKALMGFADIRYLKKEGFLPLRISPIFKAGNPKPEIRIADSEFLLLKIRGDKSSQYLSALLILAPLLPKAVRIEVVDDLVSEPYIGMTLAVMRAFGVKVSRTSDRRFEIRPQSYKPADYRVEGDATAATYFSALHFLHGGSLKFKNLNLKKTIQGDGHFSSCLKLLETGTSRVISMGSMPDAAMTLAICALFAKGKTKITGLSTLRFKETDRLAALEKELKKLGIRVKTGEDFIVISALSIRNQFTQKSFSIRTYNDHRMAMCFAVLATKIPGIVIQNPGCVQKTYPNFWKDFEKIYGLPSIPDKKNLLLIGMRGSGKTYQGKKIAKMLGRQLVDLDDEIEKAEKMSIKKIVELKGWDYFRKIEQKICSLFSDSENLVIATGGGVVLEPKNMKHLKKNSFTVFIFADPQILYERIKKDTSRPSLTEKKLKDEIDQVWQERRNLYLKYADCVWGNTMGQH